MPTLTEEMYFKFEEYFNDYQTCPRLTGWEQRFMERMMNSFIAYGRQFDPSIAQIEKIQEIMTEKVYV